MKRSDFIKLVATGALTPSFLFIACSNTKEGDPANLEIKNIFADTSKKLKKKSTTSEDTVDSIVELRRIGQGLAKRNEEEHNRVQLLGYYKSGDGGGGAFYWDTNATDRDNGGTIIRPNSKKAKSAGRWKRVIEEGQVNVKDFGAKGDGSGVDDQPAIQKAIDYASENDIGEVVIPKGDYTVNIVTLPNKRDTSIILKDGIHLKMDGNAILRLPQSENRTSYNILEIRKADNVIIEGGTIIGNKLSSTATSGQAGLGIGIYDSAKSFIKGVTIKACWADGVYISNGRQIELRDVICDNNRRQGMSVINVNGLIVKNCQFNNTEGIAPESGIDFEPNRTIEELKKIKIENVKCIGNAGKGILFYLKRMASTEDEQKVTIELNNVYIENSGQEGITVSSFNKPGTGSIKIKNTTVKNNQAGAAYRIKKWHKDAPSITFENIVAINPNLRGVGGPHGGSALSFNLGKGYRNGNLHVNGFEVKNDKSAVGKAPYDIFVPPNLWNCSFKNIKSKTNKLRNLSDLDSKRNNFLGADLSKRLMQK